MLAGLAGIDMAYNNTVKLGGLSRVAIDYLINSG